MKVLQISINDTNGCTSASHRIHRSVLETGVDSTLFVRDKVLNDPTVKGWDYNGSLLKRGWLRLRAEIIKSAMKPYRKTRPRGFDSFSDSRSAFGSALLPEMAGYDLLHLHWFREFVDWRLLCHPQLEAKPLVLTLHDMVSFTGGCHHADDCDRFQERCGRCPQLGSQSERDLSRRNWERKHEALARRSGPTRVVGCSQWIAEKARRSSLLGRFPIKVIHNGIDVEVFRPRDKAAARNLLGIPADAAVIMFIATSIANVRKGISYLAEALKGMQSSRKIVLLSAGSGNPPLPGGLAHIQVGMVNNELFLSLIYSAADLFVIPSLAENFPLTALEAGACGLPVVGFNVGGIPEVIEDGRTGFVAPYKDADALRRKITDLVADPARCAEMGARNRQRVESHFSQQIQGRNYSDCYAEMRPDKPTVNINRYSEIRAAGAAR